MLDMRARISSLRFVGRTAELERLATAFKSASADEQAGTVLLGGEAGVGKTRLVGELAGLVREADGLVLSGSCLDLSNTSLPFAPMVQALRTLQRSMDAETLATVVGPAAEVLDRLVPELQTASRDEGAGSGALFEHLLGLLERLGDHAPTLLVLEDLHWADHSTRDLVAYLAHNLADARVMVLCTYRSDDLNRRHPLRPVLAELDRSGAAEHIELSRFDREELREMVTSILGAAPDPGLLDAVFERTEGNAFFSEELIAAGSADELPESVREIVLARIDGLSDSAQRLLGIVSVIGRRADHRLITAVCDTSEAASSDGLRAATDQQVLTVDQDDGAYLFRHALVCEAVYDDLLPGERVRLHARLAELLTEHPEWCEGGSSAQAGELAGHWFAAHDTRRALPASIDAARAAERMFAYPEALAHVERALELWTQVGDAAELCGIPHVDLLIWAAELAESSGSLDRAIDFMSTAATVVDDQTDAVTLGLLHQHWGGYLCQAGRPLDEVLQHCKMAVELIPGSEPGLRARALASLGSILMVNSRCEESVDVCEEAITYARQAGDLAIESHARNSLGVSLSGLGDVDGGLAQLDLSHDKAVEARSWDDVGRAYGNKCSILTAAGRHAEAVECSAEGIEVGRAHGRGRRVDTHLRPTYCENLWAVGRWREIGAELAEIDTTQLAGIDEWCITRGVTESLAGLGEMDAARVELERYRAMLGTTVAPRFQVELANLDIEVELWSGHVAAAVERAREGMGITSDLPLCADTNAAIGIPLFAMAAATRAGSGSREAATEFAARFAQWVRDERWGTGPPAEVDTVQRQMTAEVAFADGSGNAEDWAVLADEWSEFGRIPWTAYARTREAELRLAGGDRSAAGAAGRLAYELAETIGWRWLLDLLADMARRGRLDIGIDTVASPVENEFGLTERELGVLALVAAGRTNRQIAEELFISTKTASAHVSSLLSKLGVTNRGEAGAAARRLGLD
jgi:DNA-binding CsgD family transcriptional regulator